MNPVLAVRVKSINSVMAKSKCLASRKNCTSIHLQYFILIITAVPLTSVQLEIGYVNPKQAVPDKARHDDITLTEQ